MKFLYWITLPIVLIIGVAIWYWWPRSAEAGPVDPSLFLTEVSFIRRDNEELIGDTIELPVRSGIYAEIAYTPNQTLPDHYGELAVQPPRRWPMGIEIFPRSDINRKSSIQLPVFPLKPKRRVIRRGLGHAVPMKDRFISFAGTGHWTEAVGYTGVPDALNRESEESEIRKWTYFTTGSENLPGEYVYEIQIYPSTHWASSVRIAMGPPFVVKRGLLTIVEG